MRNVNLQFLLGYLGRDPEIVYKDGRARARLSVATSWRSTNGDDVTTWHSVKIWGEKAEALSNLRKGQAVWVEGRTVHETFNTKEGTPKKVTSVWAKHVEAVGADDTRLPSPTATGDEGAWQNGEHVRGTNAGGPGPMMPPGL